MAVRPIVKYPDPRLRRQTVPVTQVTDEIRQLVADMAETMFANNGAGIATVQVGAVERIYLIDAQVAGGDPEDRPLVFINPEILWLSEETEVHDEGCLSFPEIFVAIERSVRARVRAVGLDGRAFEAEGEGLFARAMQHEDDHLTGKVLADYVGPLKRKLIKRRLERAARDAKKDSAESGDEPKAPTPGSSPGSSIDAL